MRKMLCLLALVLIPVLADAQTQQYPPLPNGMRIQVGQAVLARNTPSLSGTCGTPAHACTTADAIPSGTYGVIQPDAPVLDASGWYWQKITYQYAGGVTGWSSSYPPYIQQLSPPQMVQGIAVSVVGDYSGPALTSAICINDGVNSAAQMSLQPNGTIVSGTLLCGWGMPGVGNHKAVIKAVNNAGTADSTEFQFAVTTAPIQTPPNAPSNLRIAPATGATATQTLEEASKPTK